MVIDKKRITVKQLQVLAGYLNFLTKAIFPGHVFTRRIYAKFSQLQLGKNNRPLKHYHHVNIDQELRFDCLVWKLFLDNYKQLAVCHPMINLDQRTCYSTELNFYLDASKNKLLGFGAVFGNRWIYAQWEPNYIEANDPSIEYLELLALTAALLTWGHLLQNQRIVIFCDNAAVVAMVNSMTSSCKSCMFLLHLIVLNNLVNNRRVFCEAC